MAKKAPAQPTIPLIDVRTIRTLPASVVRTREWPNGIRIFPHTFSPAPAETPSDGSSVKPPAPAPEPKPAAPEV